MLERLSEIQVAKPVWQVGDRFQFSFDRGDISLEQIIEQAALVGAQLLAVLGELVPFEDGDFVGKLFVARFKVVDFLAHGIDMGQQLNDLFRQGARLFSGHLGEVCRESHGRRLSPEQARMSIGWVSRQIVSMRITEEAHGRNGRSLLGQKLAISTS